MIGACLLILEARQQWHTAGKTLKMGFKIGLLFGVCEDVLSALQGRRLGYVEYVKRVLGISSSSGIEPTVPG
jgi:hypothetical protein